MEPGDGCGEAWGPVDLDCSVPHAVYRCMPYTNVYRRSNDLLKINSAQSDHSDSDDGAGLGHGVLM